MRLTSIKHTRGASQRSWGDQYFSQGRITASTGHTMLLSGAHLHAHGVSVFLPSFPIWRLLLAYPWKLWRQICGYIFSLKCQSLDRKMYRWHQLGHEKSQNTHTNQKGPHSVPPNFIDWLEGLLFKLIPCDSNYSRKLDRAEGGPHQSV